MENHFIELGEASFSAPSFLVHFRKSLHEINRELLLSKKLFDKAPAGFSKELFLSKMLFGRAPAVPNGVIVLFPRSAQFSYRTNRATIYCFNDLALEPL